MKTIIVFDREGNVLGTMPCNSGIKTARCMITDIPDGAEADSVSLENPRKPQASWHDPRSVEEQKREELVKNITEQVENGVPLRKAIGALEMSNAEKWALEAEVKAYGV